MTDVPITIDAALAADLHASLAELASDLMDTRELHRGVPGMDTALLGVLEKASQLSASVAPAPQSGLPTGPELGWAARDTNQTCAVPIRLALEPARAMIVHYTGWSQRFNGHLAAIQLKQPARRAPRALVHRFAGLMGYLYVDLCRPLHLQHPELESLAMGESDTVKPLRR